MTMKQMNKNISAEIDQNVLTNATLNNGILTFTVEDLHENGQNRIQTPITIDLSQHKLKLKIITSARLTELASSNNTNDIKERESYIFLVPFAADEEGTYREYIWITENEGQNNETSKFEIIGSTKIDLTNYVQKSQTNGLIKNDGTIDTNNYLTSHQSLTNYVQKSNTSGVIKNDGTILNIDTTNGGTSSSSNLITSGAVNAGLNGKANSVHNHSSSNITDMEPITITITYTDNTTETLTLFKQVNNS